MHGAKFAGGSHRLPEADTTYRAEIGRSLKAWLPPVIARHGCRCAGSEAEIERLSALSLNKSKKKKLGPILKDVSYVGVV